MKLGNKKWNLGVHSKKHMMLLEVLIAMFIVAMCIIPLIAPHVAMLKAQHNFTATIRADHYAHLLYVDVLEQLQMNRITWNQIQDAKEIPVDDVTWKRIDENSLAKFKGYYQFQEIKHKSNEQTGWSGNLFSLIINLETLDNQKKWSFPYKVYILKKGPKVAAAAETQNNKSEEKTK